MYVSRRYRQEGKRAHPDRVDKKCWRNVSRFVSPSYLDVNLVIIVHTGIFHKNVLKFQVSMHNICKEEHSKVMGLKPEKYIK